MQDVSKRLDPRFCAMCAAAAFISICASGFSEALPAAVESALRAAVADRERAIVDKDKELFMSLLDASEPEFLLEQSRWFDYRMSAELRGFSLEIAGMERLGDSECRVVLRQKYEIGPGWESRDVSYSELYRRGGNGWRDADLYSTSVDAEHFLVKCAIPPDESPSARTARLRGAAKAAQDAESAWATIARAWGETPSGKTTIKLFADRELLRQNSKITIDRLFNGWGEPGESIKLYLRPEASRNYASVIAHELIHKATLERARNLCSWFAEGLAVEYGSFPAMGGSYLDGGFHRPSDYDRSVAWLESLDPELIDDDALWWIYGGMSAAVVAFIADTWGEETPMNLVRALAAYPQPDSGYIYSLSDASFRAELHDAIQAHLGVDSERFELLWRAWIRGK